MKRLCSILFIAALLVGTVSAQNRGNRQNMNDRLLDNQAISVTGTLQLERGFIAVASGASGESVYLVPLLTRYIGFIEGLKEGSEISIEGYRNNRNIIHPTVVTLNEKTYNFPAYRPRQQMNNDFRPGAREYRRGGHVPQCPHCRNNMNRYCPFEQNNFDRNRGNNRGNNRGDNRRHR
jgi:hypothetical protein